MPDPHVDVSIAVVTHNRRDELRLALASVVAQQGVTAEVIVVDDGSADGTSDMVTRDFPEARLHRQEVAQGCACSRNVATDQARADVIVYLDDDAELPSRHTVRQTLALFDDERIAVVAIPFEDVIGDERIMRQRASSDAETWIQPTFVAAAYAVRAAAFRSVGGFASAFHSMYGEEADLSLRLLDRGQVIRVGRADAAIHRPSAVRSLDRMDVLGRRNEIVWAWKAFPAPWHLVYMAGYVVKGLLWGLRVRRPGNMVRGLAMGARAVPGVRRDPVSRRAFRVDRRLRREGQLPLRLVRDDLPPDAMDTRG